MRPDWWLTWLPPTCVNGHELAPGRINLSWVSCGYSSAWQPSTRHVTTWWPVGWPELPSPAPGHAPEHT